MPDVLRWGRSTYETDASLREEQRAAEALGLTWALREDRQTPGDLTGVRALVVPSKVTVSGDVLASFPGELVLTTTSGYDHIDIREAHARGVTVARCPIARRDPVVEQALALGMFLMRRQPALGRAAREGVWARGALDGLAPRGLAGATVLVVGLGVIGTRVAELLQTLGAVVVGQDPAGLPAGVMPATDLSMVDLVTLHCSLTPTSRGFAGAALFDALPDHAVVVNTARGAVLDVEEAVRRVATGQLRGLATDVFPHEPYDDLARGAAVEGVMFTPHSAGFVHDLGQRVAREVGANLGAWARGEPLPGSVGQDVLDRL